MVSVSSSYSESLVQVSKPRSTTENATQTTSVSAHLVDSSEHLSFEKPAPLVSSSLVTQSLSFDMMKFYPDSSTITFSDSSCQTLPLVTVSDISKSHVSDLVDKVVCTPEFSYSSVSVQSSLPVTVIDNSHGLQLSTSIPSPYVTSASHMVSASRDVALVLCDSSSYHLIGHESLPVPVIEEEVPLDSGDLEWELVDDHLKVLQPSLINISVQTEEQYIQRSESHHEFLRSVSASQTTLHTAINRKNFSVQYIYEPLQENIGCQTQLLTQETSKTVKASSQDCETMTDEKEPQVAVLLQNISSTDIRERLIERYYYSSPRTTVLVTDAETQVNLISTAYRGHTRDVYLKETSMDYRVRSFKESEDTIIEESSEHDDSDNGVPVTSTASYSEYVKHLLHEGSVTEVWEKGQPTHSVYESYQSRREYGSVREQASMAMEEPVAAADVGIQITFDSHTHSSPSDTEISRSESPLSGSSYTYEAYMIRSRLGQICEVQCQFCPTHITSASQTDHHGHGIQSERRETLSEDIFDSYHRKLIKDEIAEAWTQVEHDSEYRETTQLEQISEPIDMIEERFLEITEKKSKKVFSQIKITEEYTEDEDLIVCELGVQTDPHDDHHYHITPKEPYSSMTSRIETEKHLVHESIQTSVIHLANIIATGDLEWADSELQTSFTKYKSQHSRFEYDSPEKVLVTTGTQVIPIELNLEKRFQKEWTTETMSFHHHHHHHKASEAFQEESDISDKVEMLTEGKNRYRRIKKQRRYDRFAATSQLSLWPKILVQLRQRTLQYELFESQYSTTSMHWNNIREVASPRTGLFAPVAMAIRRGWIRLGEVNEYIDPMTGVAIPLETAYQQGRIRWCKAYLTSVIDTATGEVLTPDTAILNGILETTEDEIRLLDSATNTWITIEEGAGRQIIQLEPSTPTTESMEDELDEPASCKVYQLTHICPGGEPSPWLNPLEAVRLGLLNWENGEVAADWPARPVIRSTDTTGQFSSDDFIPTRWCSFLTAKQAGWLRFTEELEPRRHITTSGMPNNEPGSLILSKQVNLLAPSQPSLNYLEEDDISEPKYQQQNHQPQHASHSHRTELYIPRTRSEEVYPIIDNINSSNLFPSINVIAGHSKSASFTRMNTKQSVFNEYHHKLIPSRIQIQHESDERSWASETQIWEEYQDTSSRTISPDNSDTHGHR
ncbi:unnamed protein product [Trichobilharzia regenti]|nr:unnamed protein product [Trichobilharzia regenti]